MATGGYALLNGDGAIIDSFSPGKIRYNFQAPTIALPSDSVVNNWGTGAVSVSNDSNRPTILCDAGANANSGGTIYFEATTNGSTDQKEGEYIASKNPVAVWAMKVPNITDTENYAYGGFWANPGSYSSSLVLFDKSQSSNWLLFTRKAGTGNTTDSGVAVTTDWLWFKLTVTTSAVTIFYSTDNASTWTQLAQETDTSYIPVIGMSFTVGAVNLAAAAGDCDVHLWKGYLEQDV